MSSSCENQWKNATHKLGDVMNMRLKLTVWVVGPRMCSLWMKDVEILNGLIDVSFLFKSLQRKRKMWNFGIWLEEEFMGLLLIVWISDVLRRLKRIMILLYWPYALMEMRKTGISKVEKDLFTQTKLILTILNAKPRNSSDKINPFVLTCENISSHP